jgi:hypothetical protein
VWRKHETRELAQNMVAGLPFVATFPEGWLFEYPAGYGKEALFGAVDPASPDANQRTGFLLLMYPPADDANAFLDEQEAEFRTGIASDRAIVSSGLSRVDLQSGKALRALMISEHQALIQYYVPTAEGIFALWFTTPSNELSTHMADLDSIAQSFRLREQQPS